MEGVVAPEHRHVVGLGAGLERAVEPAEPVGHELLAAHPDLAEAGAARVAAEVTGREGVDVDEPLERRGRLVVGPAVVRSGRRLAPSSRRHSGRERDRRCAWGARRGGRRAATARRRTRSGRRAAARGETRRTRAAGSGRWCSTAWPSTRSKLPSANGSDSASARAVRTSSPSRSALAPSVRDHPRRDVGAGRLPDDAGLEQVEAEVAGAGADLQRAAVAAVELRSEQLAQLARAPALWPTAPKSMPHFES